MLVERSISSKFVRMFVVSTLYFIDGLRLHDSHEYTEKLGPVKLKFKI